MVAEWYSSERLCKDGCSLYKVCSGDRILVERLGPCTNIGILNKRIMNWKNSEFEQWVLKFGEKLLDEDIGWNAVTVEMRQFASCAKFEAKFWSIILDKIVLRKLSIEFKLGRNLILLIEFLKAPDKVCSNLNPLQVDKPLQKASRQTREGKRGIVTRKAHQVHRQTHIHLYGYPGYWPEQNFCTRSHGD